MIRQLSCILVVAGIYLGNFASSALPEESPPISPSIVLPTDPFSFQPGNGQDIANTYCLICHSAEYIYMQPKHSTQKWHDIIQKMQKVFGCPIPQEQIPALASYLFQQNSVTPQAPTASQ